MSEQKRQKIHHAFLPDEDYQPINYLLLMVISKLPVLFLELCDVKDIYNISLTSKSSWWYICNSFPGLKPRNISYHVYQKDPWKRDFSRDIPNLGIVGIKVMPCPDFNIRRFCIENGFRNDLVKLPSHVYLLIDKSGSTSQHCCTIENGEYQGRKTNLDIMKMFIASLIEVMKQDNRGSKNFQLDKITVLTFDGDIKCYADSMKIDDIDPNILDEVMSSGSTDYNKAIKDVTRRVKQNKDSSSKLFVLTDCECNVDKNVMQDLVKARCSNSTLFVAPGDRRTLENIARYANSGVHKELPLDFSKETTVGEWCDIGAQFLLLDPISCVIPHHSDGTRPMYNVSECVDGYILESVRPILKVNEMSSSIVSVYDITGEREVKVNMKVKLHEPDHKTFALCIHKMVTSVKKRSTELQSERSKFMNDKFHLQNLEKKIISNTKSKNLVNFSIWVLQNKDSLNPRATTIQALVRGFNTRRIWKIVVQNDCTWAQAEQFNFESSDDFDELPPPPMFGNQPLQRQFGSDFPSYPRMSFYDQGFYGNQEQSLDELNDDLYFIEQNLSELRLELIELETKIKEFNQDKNYEETFHLFENLQRIRDVLITGLSSDEKILSRTLGLSYNKVDFNGSSLVFSCQKVKEHIPLLGDYDCYNQILSFLQSTIDLIKHYIDKYNSIIPDNLFYGFNIESLVLRSFNGDAVPFVSNAGYESNSRSSLFRQVSAYPLPSIGLMRQTSDGMASRGPMTALRSLSSR